MLKRAAKWASIVLAMSALAYFLRHAWRTLQGQDLSALHGAGLWGMVLLTALYTASIATTAVAWRWQLAALGHRVTFSWSITVLAVTQFGKYLPGNVGHHIGRAGLAIDAGIRTPVALLTIGYELLLALVSAAHLGALAVLLWPPEALSGQPWLEHRWALLGLVSAGAVAGLLLAPRMMGVLIALRGGGRRDSRALSLDLRAIGGSYAMYVVGQVAIGCGLWGLAIALSPTGTVVPPALFFTGAFATSWIAGLVVPGAPAGLGVREVVLTAWLGDALPPETAVLLVVALRVATTLGDAINFGWGSWALARTRARRPATDRQRHQAR
jgi:hypothetical protein